jgi:DNA helicase II / ATP-dependent DNA helicase PcrA
VAPKTKKNNMSNFPNNQLTLLPTTPVKENNSGPITLDSPALDPTIKEQIIQPTYGFSDNRIKLNPQQKAAATYNGSAKNILVKAGAGCGKTSTIVARANHLLDSGTNPSEMVIIAFTNKAAKELKDRISHQIDIGGEKMFVGTFHSFCHYHIKHSTVDYGIQNSLIIDESDQNDLVRLTREKMIVDYPEAPDLKELPIRDICKYLSYIRNSKVPAEEYLTNVKNLPISWIPYCKRIFKDYQEAKKERGFVDFDDMLEIFSMNMKQNPTLRSKVMKKYKYLLVDEFQDTNPLQFDVIECFQTEGVNLYCVGDPAQSIYGFRGAEFERILNFTQINDNSIELPLSLNYRSTQPILNLANWLLEQSPIQYNSKLTTPNSSESSAPVLSTFISGWDEINFVCDNIMELYHSGTPLKDIMVLSRRSNVHGLESILLKRNIPYVLYGGTSLTKLAHVRDFLSLIRIVVNRYDDLAWARYLKLWKGIGKKTASKIIADLAVNTMDIMSTLRKQLRKDHELIQVYWAVLSANKLSPKEAVKDAIRLLKEVIKNQDYENWSKREKDLDAMASLIENFETLEDFVDTLSLNPNSPSQIHNKPGRDSLIVSTVHSAKGLEANACFVIDATPDNYPHKNSITKEEIEEDRRVLYVALTRAKKQLHITRVWHPDDSIYLLSNIPENLVSEVTYSMYESKNLSFSPKIENKQIEFTDPAPF